MVAEERKSDKLKECVMVTSESVIAVLYPEPSVAHKICDICGYTCGHQNVVECGDGIRRCCICRRILSAVIHKYGGHRQYINGNYRHTVRS